MKVLPAYLPMYLSCHPETEVDPLEKASVRRVHTHTWMCMFTQVSGTKGPFNIVMMTPSSPIHEKKKVLRKLESEKKKILKEANLCYCTRERALE